MTEDQEKRMSRVLSEIATAILRQNAAKNLHNLAMLEAIEDEDHDVFRREWEEHYDRKW